jgi:hypothetical protein
LRSLEAQRSSRESPINPYKSFSNDSSSDENSSTQATQPSRKRRRVQSKPKKDQARLDLEAKIFVLHTACRDTNIYSKITWKKFGAMIAKELEEESGVKHITLSWTVNELVKKQKTFLERVRIGKEENNTEYNTSIDTWIEIVDQEADALHTKKWAAGEPDKDTEDSLLVCRDLTHAWPFKERCLVNFFLQNFWRACHCYR